MPRGRKPGTKLGSKLHTPLKVNEVKIDHELLNSNVITLFNKVNSLCTRMHLLETNLMELSGNSLKLTESTLKSNESIRQELKVVFDKLTSMCGDACEQEQTVEQ